MAFTTSVLVGVLGLISRQRSEEGERYLRDDGLNPERGEAVIGVE